eukprot:Skav201671  [mRNA]  locus=scaffold641:347419:347784:+ [translate_table: standard]
MSRVCFPAPRYPRFFLLGSPSLAWDNGAFFRLEEEGHQSRRPLDACVYASCGGKEQGQIQNLRNFQRQLDSRSYPDLSITVEIVEGAADETVCQNEFACQFRVWTTANFPQHAFDHVCTGY